MSDVFSALADQSRRTILELVAVEPLASAALGKKTKLSATALDKHLKVLVEVELLTVVTKGATSTYSLNKAGFGEAAKWFGKFGSAFVAGQADMLGENIGNLLSSAAGWLEKRVGTKLNFDFDPEQTGKELGRKLSDAKREATDKVGEASVKVKDAAKKATDKVTDKVAGKKAPAKKAPAKKAPANKPTLAKKPAPKPVSKKVTAKKPVATKLVARKPKA